MRYLVGPAASEWAADRLTDAEHAGECLCLGVDLPTNPMDTWSEILSRLPSGWQPDWVIVWLPDPRVPDGLWAAPVPVIGLATDWDRHAHYYRHATALCDAVLTDPADAARAAHGCDRVYAADLYGPGPRTREQCGAPAERDIDVLVLDDLHPALRREQLPWAGRIAQLADRCHVVIRRPATSAENRDWLARAKVVVQLPGPGGDRMADEALAAGAALVRVSAAGDEPGLPWPGVDAISCDARSLETQILTLLNHEAERRRVAIADAAQVRERSLAACLEQTLATLDPQELANRVERRRSGADRPRLGQRVWAAVAGGPPPPLPAAGAAGDGPETATARGVFAPDPSTAIEAFRLALALDPTHPVAAANLTEALARAERPDEAVAAARTALGRLETTITRPLAAWDVPLYPLDDLLARFEWERAMWQAGGDSTAETEAKRDLLRWRLHTLLARLTDDLSEYHEAALARPDLAAGRAALGCALARRGRVSDALPHLRAAVAADPFDRAAARALAAALMDAGDRVGLRRFVRQQRRLTAAAPEECPAEDWFAESGPTGDELASVVVVAHDQPELTRQCLESVMRQTRPPFELVLVDNGSATETADLLRSYTDRPGPARVELIQTGVNLGYPAAANRGLAAARGEFMILLNNDTIATPDWLDGLIERFLDGWPRVGLVGPMTNAAPEPQRTPPGYADPAGLDEFARARRRARTGEYQRINRLSGFCLLTHRSVVAAVGPLDEQFGAGFFDDDDWCIRVRRAGYELLVAADVYLHHSGNATFRALGLDARALLDANFEKFRAKWGDAEVAPYRPPADPVRRPTVSLCLIVRDEERHLPDCLASTRDLVDEVVVVDTGSADRTRDVAAGFGARVFDFLWVDSFAAARNESLRHATGAWVLWLDADDRLDAENRVKLRSLVASLNREPAAYVMKCHCLSGPAGAGVTVVDHVRLFPNDPRLRWRYRVHEQILPAVRAAGLPVRWTGVAVTHVGYADPAARARKLERDLRLLRQEEVEQPEEPFVLFNLGSVLLERGQPDEALSYLERSLVRSHPKDSIVRKLYALIAACHRHAGREEAALRACEAGRRYYPDDAELLFTEGSLRQGRSDWADAAACWRRLVEGRDGEHFASVNAGLRGPRARHNLAAACWQLGRVAEAEEQWRRAAAEEPTLRAAWRGLGAVGLARGDRQLVGEAAAGLEVLGEVGRQEAAELRARLATGASGPPVYVG